MNSKLDKICVWAGRLICVAGFFILIFHPALVSYGVRTGSKNPGLWKAACLGTGLFFVILGVLTWTFRRKTIERFLLFIFSFAVFMGTLELALRTGFFDGRDNPAPVWIPAKFRVADGLIDAKNAEFAAGNPYGFTDKVRSIKKPAGVQRIAVLSDSFVWGDGLPYDKTWSHKLERKIIRKFPRTEVLSWGKNGWQTLTEFYFLWNEGFRYQPDVVLVGFVTNDPDMGDYPQKLLEWNGARLFSPVRFFFPNALDFLSSYINRFVEHFFKQYGYYNWEDKLYTAKNLMKYEKLLKMFSAYCKTKHVQLIFILTPNHYHPQFRGKFDKIIPLLKDTGIEVLDLYPAVYAKLHGVNYRKLWANPADGHPGDAVTTVYADEVFAYLVRKNILR